MKNPVHLLAFVVVLVGVPNCLRAEVRGFVETFSGTGEYGGLDNSGWGIIGDSEFVDGGLRLENVGGPDTETSSDVLTQRLSGGGSFTTTVEFDSFELGDSVFDESVAGVALWVQFSSQDRMIISLFESEGTPEESWKMTLFSTDHEVTLFEHVPLVQGGPIRLVGTYDDDQKSFSASYEFGDALEPVRIGPIDVSPEIVEGQYGTELHAFATTKFIHQKALLTHYSVAPFTRFLGDFDGSGGLNAGDIDMLAYSIREGNEDPAFDLNSDSFVDNGDRDTWVHDLANTYFGDANLDGEFSSADLVNVFVAGEYEDDVPLNSTWATGDWNGDGDFTSSDIVLAFEDGGYEQGPRAAVVPESSSLTLAGLGLVLVGSRLGRRK